MVKAGEKMESEEENREPTGITIATIRSTAKRNSAMRILTFLNKNSDAHTITEISDELDMEWGTAQWNLMKLETCGFLELVEDKMDGRCKYYKIADKIAVEKVIELYRKRQDRIEKKEEETKLNPKVEEPRTEVEEVS
jgi:DNA-binding MarR family transcriptional regulator